MIDLDVTLFIQFINFIIVLIVLNILLIRPIRGIIQKRAEIMSGRMDEIEKFSSQAESKLKNYHAALDEARAQGSDIRAQMKGDGVEEERKLTEAAHKEASETLGAARQEIAGQVDTAMTSLKGQVDTFAKQATEKILGKA